MLAVSGVQMDLKDVSYYMRKKQGFPSITDQGLMDIFMGGEGFSFKIAMENATATNTTHFFEVTDVKVQIKNLNIKLKKSKFKLLFGLGKPILLHVLKPAITKVLEAAIKKKARDLDSIIFQIHQEAQKAKRDAINNPDPENIKGIYQQYWSAANQQWMKAKQKKEKAKEKVEDKKFNMAMTKKDSIFPNVDLPSGISTKATEYKELAAKGDRWESPVFGIGRSKESTHIPSPPQVRRKHLGHSTGTGSGLTGGAGQSLGGSTLGQGQGYTGTNNGAFNGATNGSYNGAQKYSNGADSGAYQIQPPGSRTFDPTIV